MHCVFSRAISLAAALLMLSTGGCSHRQGAASAISGSDNAPLSRPAASQQTPAVSRESAAMAFWESTAAGGTGNQSSGPLESAASPADPNGVLTLREALSIALLKNPELAAYSYDTRAAEARVLQAGLLPNPEIEVEVENFGGRRERSEFQTAETTFLLSQLIELGGKRSLRTRVAGLEKDLIDWDYAVKRLDVLTEVTRAFIDALSAQEQSALAGETVKVAEKVYQTVSERAEAGKVAPLETTRSGIELAKARMEYVKAMNSLEAARKRLSATWGQAAPTFERVEGDLEAVHPLPSADELNRLLSANPDIARWVKEREQREAALALEEVKRVPDLKIGGGVRRFEETDDHAFVLGVSIPLPVFNRNQGGIREARAKLEKASFESTAAQTKATGRLAEAYQTLVTSHAEAMSLKNDVLPAVELAFQGTSIGYREGKLDLLELLHAEQMLSETRGRYIQALTSYHKAAADIERLIGQGLNSAFVPGSSKGTGEAP